jgi:hypothetical protein
MLLSRKSGCKGTTFLAYLRTRGQTIYCFLTIKGIYPESCGIVAYSKGGLHFECLRKTLHQFFHTI